MSTPANSNVKSDAMEPLPTDASAGPNFSAIVSTAQERSAERAEQRRKRDEAILNEQQTRWDDGIALLNAQVRPLLERALQACVEECIPAILEDNFSETAATPRLLFYCRSPVQERDGCRVLGGESDRLVLQSDGKTLRIGTAKSFSTSPDAMRICDDIGAQVTALFSAILESYFQSCEQAARYKSPLASDRSGS